MYIDIYVHTYIHIHGCAPAAPPMVFLPLWCGGGCFEMKNDDKIIIELQCSSSRARKEL